MHDLIDIISFLLLLFVTLNCKHQTLTGFCFRADLFFWWAWKAQVAVRMLHRALLQAAWLSFLWALQVGSCPEVCSKCSGPENDQCDECRAGWMLHNNTCVGTVHKSVHEAGNDHIHVCKET